jgi:hypothetical protein
MLPVEESLVLVNHRPVAQNAGDGGPDLSGCDARADRYLGIPCCRRRSFTEGELRLIQAHRPADDPRTGRTPPNRDGRHTASDQHLCVHCRPPESAEMGLWTAEKREVIGSTPIPATVKRS